MPRLDVLRPQKTIHHALNIIPHDESTNSGNISVLEHIYRRQYCRRELDFSTRLDLIYGDQKTVQRLHTIKRRRARSNSPYESLRWALPIPALFHLKMNFLYMISRCHFGGSNGKDQSTLYAAMNFWQRKKINNTNPQFFALEELVIHSYQARICAIQWNLLDPSSGPRPLTRSMLNRCDVVRQRIESKNSEEMTNLLRDINNIIKANLSTDDEELQNHARFLQLAETYIVLKYSIKHADLGLLRRVVSRCCLLFNGSGQYKYAFEMLHLHRLVSTSAASAVLQRAILANSLVNFKGEADTWFETDRMVEFHNGDMKAILKARRGSTLTIDKLFELSALNSAYFDRLRVRIEEVYGVTRINGDHTRKSAKEDIVLMADWLATSSILATPGRKSNYVAPNLVNIGGERLAGDALYKFNNHFSRVQPDDPDDGEDQIDELPPHFYEFVYSITEF
jgi:hypothetical protein